MKKLFERGIDFVLSNQTMLSSILLIFVVVGALFLNSYVALDKFQDSADKTLRGKALLVENIIEIASEEYILDQAGGAEKLQERLLELEKIDSEIAAVNLFKFDSAQNSYIPVVGSKDSEGKEKTDPQKELIAQNARKFAVSVDDAFAYLSSDGGTRYWNVVKSLKGKNGDPFAIVQMKLSLAESDNLMEKTIITVYALSIGSIMVVLLLIFNHFRLFKYEVKAKKLEEIDKMKDDFISMASHELKSPLTAIGGYCELLTDTICESKGTQMQIAQKKYLHNIDVSVERLKTLVEDLLDVSRIEQGRLPFDCKPLDINELITNMVEEMKVMADQKKLEMVNKVEKVPLVVADPDRLKQILVNLLSNAIKYTPSGKVEIQSREDDKWVYLTVADSGVGISSENLSKLFAKFYRIRSIETADITGTGLGLWIAREVAEKMGGTLTAESMEGVGSHFILKLKKS